MDGREKRSLELADAGWITPDGKEWVVPSHAARSRYKVTLDGDTPRCTCPDRVMNLEAVERVGSTVYVPFKSNPCCRTRLGMVADVQVGD